jgi:IclR family transcriptional regulator, acetate operon repressor
MVAVRSADRTVSLFETFEALRRPLALSELAGQMDIPVSSCHSLVQTLIQRGFLYSLGSRKAIYSTRRLLSLAEAIVHDDPVLERAEPTLMQLRELTQETVIIGKRQGDAVIYLGVWEGFHSIRYSARPGDYKPLHSSAIGKALLGSLPIDAMQAWLDKRPLPKVTEATLTNREQFEKDLDIGRTRGYFMTRGENVADVSAISASVILNNELFAIAVAGPGPRIDCEESVIAQNLLKCRDRLRKSFG